jgi:hypothetical protein
MAQVGYSVTLEDESNALAALGDLKSKAPVALKNAANATAVRAKNMMIRQGKVRYALNTTGLRHLNQLKIRTRATVTRPAAVLYISSSVRDLADFKTSPTEPHMGWDYLKSPDKHAGKVLKWEQLKLLSGNSRYSKGFLVQFRSGHVAMVQRDTMDFVDSKKKNANGVILTERSSRPRWTNKDGKVEKIQTYSSPSASAMHSTLWREDVSYDAAALFQAQLKAQVIKILQKAGRQVL